MNFYANCRWQFFCNVVLILGLSILKTPFRAPQANAFCERLVGTIPRECSGVTNFRTPNSGVTEW
jgi:hypothetical protein